MDLIQVGSLVEHKAWGRGKILALRPPNAQAYFPSIGPHAGGALKLVQLAVLTLSEVQSDPLFDSIERDSRRAMKDRTVLRRPPKRPAHGLTAAIEWFEREYPGQFSDTRLVKHEITYKRAAHQLFTDRLGGGRGRALLASGNNEEIGTLLDALYHATNIPSRFEVMAAHDGLKAPDAAARLLTALLDLLESPGSGTFSMIVEAVGSLPAPAGGSRVLTWPNVTILPFLADPAQFIVTKPAITKQIAGRMEIDLLYSTDVKWDTYKRVLEMSGRLLELLRPIGANDFIDVQSFIWVTRALA